MKSLNIQLNIQQNFNSMTTLYNTISMILNPTLNDYQQKFLSLIISTLISQIKFLIELSSENIKEKNQKDKLINSNISFFSKNIANILSYIKDKEIKLYYNKQQSFSIIDNSFKLNNDSSKKKENDTNIILKKNTNNNNNKIKIKIQKNNNMKKNNHSNLKKSKLINGIKQKIIQKLSKKKNDNIMALSLEKNILSNSNSLNSLFKKKNQIYQIQIYI